MLTFVTLSGFSPLTCQEVRVTKWDLLEGLSTAQDLFDCVFVNDSTVVAVGSNGVVRRGVPTKLPRYGICLNECQYWGGNGLFRAVA